MVELLISKVGAKTTQVMGLQTYNLKNSPLNFQGIILQHTLSQPS